MALPSNCIVLPGDTPGALPFDMLMKELQRAHNEEVQRLRAENLALKEAASNSAVIPEPQEPEKQESEVKAQFSYRSNPSTSELLMDPKDSGPPALEQRRTSSAGASAASGSPARAMRSNTSIKKKRPSQRSFSEEDLAVLGAGEFSLKYIDAWGRRLVFSPWFEGSIGFAILLNVILVFVNLEFKGRGNGVLIGATQDLWAIDAHEQLELVSTVFTILFGWELLLKLIFLRLQLFCHEGRVQWFAIFDTVVVSVSVLDLMLLSAVGGEEADGSSNFSLMRAFRVVRLMRILRVARMFSFFGSLRVLLSAVFGSFLALFWSMVLLCIVMLMGGLFLSQSLQDTIEDVGASMELRQWLYRHYGTASRSCWSVFELTFSGGWPTYVRPLVEEVSFGFAFFFFGYVTTVIFAMFRVITAMFLKDTLRVASLDVDNTIDEKLAEKGHYQDKLANFFYTADESGDGVVSLDEFDAVMENERVKAYFGALELDPSKTRQLFELADEDGSGSITIDEFVHCAMRMKGAARALDTAMIARSIAEMKAKLDEVATGLTI